MGLQDVAFCPTVLVFPPHFIKIMVEVKASGPPHLLKLWLGISKGMLSANSFTPTNHLFTSIEIICHNDEVNLATITIGDIPGLKIMSDTLNVNSSK